MDRIEVTMTVRNGETVAECPALNIRCRGSDYDRVRTRAMSQIDHRRRGSDRGVVFLAGDPARRAGDQEPVPGLPLAHTAEERETTLPAGVAPQWIVDFVKRHEHVRFTTEDARRVSRKFKRPLTEEIIEERRTGR